MGRLAGVVAPHVAATTAQAPAAARPAETIPPLVVDRPQSDPTYGLAELLEAHRLADVDRWFAELERQAAARARPRPRADRGGQRSSRTATPAQWAALRRCENGGSYTSKPGDKYRGAYQFAPSTWASVGGTGDPADAEPAEQDRRAAILLAREGPGQWPRCGRHLR